MSAIADGSCNAAALRGDLLFNVYHIAGL